MQRWVLNPLKTGLLPPFHSPLPRTQGDVVYPAGALGIVYNRSSHSQRFFAHDPAGGAGGLPAPAAATAVMTAPASANAAVDTPVAGGAGPFLGHTGAIVCIARHPLGAMFATGEVGRRYAKAFFLLFI